MFEFGFDLFLYQEYCRQFLVLWCPAENELYKNYILTNLPSGNDSYDYHRQDLVELLCHWLELRNSGLTMSDLENDPKLPEVLEFIYQVYYLAEQKDLFLRSLPHPDLGLGDFLPCDGWSFGIRADRKNHTFTIGFLNILTYGNARLNINEFNVDYTDLVIVCHGVTSIKLRGSLGLKYYVLLTTRLNIIQRPGKDPCLALIAPHGSDGVVLEVTFQELTWNVKPGNYYKENKLCLP